MTTSDASLVGDFAAPSDVLWRTLVEKALKGADFDRRLVARTADGIRIEPLYTRATPLPATLGVLASRRIDPTAAWQMRQLCRETDTAMAARALAEETEAGAGGVVISVEAPGQSGLPAAALPDAVAHLPLERTGVALQAGEHAIAAGEALFGTWEKRQVPHASRRAAFGIDPIGTLARLGGLTEPLDAALARAAHFAIEPRWGQGNVTVLLADGRPVHEAGGSEAQELGVMLASLVAYLRACEAAGAGPADSLPRIAFGLCTDADLFLGIAKLRAARLLVRRVAEACGAEAVADRVQMTVSTSERMMARRDPWVNLLRTCAAGMAAALGGADSITILPFTAPLGRADAFARRIARNMHVVLAEESGLGRVADPAAGAWHIEALTGALVEKAWAELQAIEAAGGIAAALRSGLLQQKVAAVAAERAKSMATGRAAQTGVSAFPRLGSDGVTVEPDPLPRLPVGIHDRITPLTPTRTAAPFEVLRDRADAAQAGKGKAPQIFLANLGSVAEHSGRSTWITNFLAAGGIGAIGSDGFTSSSDAGRAFADSGATVACICASDETYALLGEATATVLKQAGARCVLLAGRPKDEATLRAAGVDDLLFAGQDALAALAKVHGVLGIA